MALTCGTIATFRHALDVTINDPAAPANAYAGDTFLYEISTDGGANWAPACYVEPGDFDTDCAGDCTGVDTVGGATAGLATSFIAVGLAPNTSYMLRATVTAGPNGHVGNTVTCGPATTEAMPTSALCGGIPNPTDTTGTARYAIATGQLDTRACNSDRVVWGYSTTPGGPYTDLPIENVSGFAPNHTLTGLAPGTTYYWRGILSQNNGAPLFTGPECSFTTTGNQVTEPAPPNFIPTPCENCGAGGGSSVDAEQNILCDYVNGEVVGSALAVYTYDENGNPTGPPQLIIPGTDDPYVPQGVMMTCPGEACLEPVLFHTTTSTTGPVDHPGRQYDITLPINPGFAVESLQVDAVTHAANIVWGVNDADGEVFRAALTSFMEGRLPAPAVVTITNPNAGNVVCGTATPMTIHIECLRIDQSPPDLVELVYNGGNDKILNPAYRPLTGFTTSATRIDNGGTIQCTETANRGWETNDQFQSFEFWGNAGGTPDGGTTPTPRGTPVQEINANGSGLPSPNSGDTIWQTFTVTPGEGGSTFNLAVVVGGRAAGVTEAIRIRLFTGDPANPATQPGDLIDTTVNAPSVTGLGGKNPWTQFTDDLPLAAGQYTLAFTGPDNGSIGGLFTDMRAYLDLPGQRATATTDDDTCVVTVDETTTVCDEQYWSPLCEAGDITGWKNAETGQVLTNAAFWGQAPAPTPGPCPATAGGEGGGSVAANLVHTYTVCAEIGGIRQNVQRVVISDASGGTLADTFIGSDGGPVAVTSYTIGSCTDTAFVNDEVLCDVQADGSAVTFLRKYVQKVGAGDIGEIAGFRDFTLAGTVYNVTGTVGRCPENASGGCETQVLCDSTSDSNPPALVTATANGPTTEYKAAYPTPGVTYDPVDVDGTGVWSGGSTVYPDKGAFAINARQVSAGDITITPLACGTPDQVQLTATVRVTRTGPNGSSGSSGAFGFHNNGVAVGTTANVPATGVGGVRVLNISATVPYADLLAGNIGIGLALQTTVNFNHGGWVADQYSLAATPTEPVTGCGTSEATRFLRTICRDAEGNVTGVVDSNFDGSPYFPEGTVRDCEASSEPQAIITEEQVCDLGASPSVSFIRRTVLDTAGAETSVVNVLPDGTTYNPVGPVSLGDCTECCPVVVSDELCYDSGAGVQKASSIRLADGTIQIIDQATGAVVDPGDVVACTTTITAQHRLIGDADTPWSPATDVAGATLVSVTYIVLSGQAVVQDSNGTSASLPAGVTATWSVDDPNTLQGPQSIDAVGGQTYVLWTQR